MLKVKRNNSRQLDIDLPAGTDAILEGRMVEELQTRLHAVVAAELEEGEAFGFARLLVRAVADGGRGDFGEVRADAGGAGCVGEVAFAWGLGEYVGSGVPYEHDEALRFPFCRVCVCVCVCGFAVDWRCRLVGFGAIGSGITVVVVRGCWLALVLPLSLL